MANLREITPEQLERNVFTAIGKDWMLIGAQEGDRVNAMTASWGGMGVLWGKNVAYVVIRPQRYTKELVDGADTFSLSFLDESHRAALNYFGTVSGRDEDKIKASGLAIAHEGDTPYFANARTVLICRKLYAQPMTPESFIDKTCDDKWYPAKDYHTMYIAEIEKVLTEA